MTGERTKGRYRARIARTSADISAVQELRYRAFIEATGAEDPGRARDADRFDSLCRHLMIETVLDGRLVATCRCLPLKSGAGIGQSYSAQHYALDALEAYPEPMLEIGRFCVEPGLNDPDVLRVAWGALTSLVDADGVGMLFGCSSFRGTRVENYLDAFAMLRDRHIAPRRWLPRVKAPDVFRFARKLRAAPDRIRALKSMPPLLRSYLAMGGWVSDHAVVDRQMNTLHVFTGLEIGKIPEARARALRAVAE